METQDIQDAPESEGETADNIDKPEDAAAENNDGPENEDANNPFAQLFKALDRQEPEPIPRVTPESSPRPASPLTDGIQAYHNGDYDTAIQRLDEVLADNAYDRDGKLQASYWRAETRAAVQYSRECAERFRETAKMNPKSYLASAAKRRAAAIEKYFDTVDPEPAPEPLPEPAPEPEEHDPETASEHESLPDPATEERDPETASEIEPKSLLEIVSEHEERDPETAPEPEEHDPETASETEPKPLPEPASEHEERDPETAPEPEEHEERDPETASETAPEPEEHEERDPETAPEPEEHEERDPESI